MIRRPSVEEACGYKQVFDKEELNGKIIKDVILKYDQLTLVFTDKTFAHFESTGDDNPYIELDDEQCPLDYNSLLRVTYGGKEGYTWENPKFELTEIGEAMGADLETLKAMFFKARKDSQEERESNEYKEYLRLKEKFENHDKAETSNT